jgi:hypothetical protein
MDEKTREQLTVLGLEIVGATVREKYPNYHSDELYKFGCRDLPEGTIQFELFGEYRYGKSTDLVRSGEKIVVSTRIEFKEHQSGMWHPLQFPIQIANQLYECLPIFDPDFARYDIHEIPTVEKNRVLDPGDAPRPEEEE